MKMIGILATTTAVVALLLGSGCKSDCEKAFENMKKFSVEMVVNEAKDLGGEDAAQTAKELGVEAVDKELGDKNEWVEKCEDEGKEDEVACVADAATLEDFMKCVVEDGK